MNELTENKLGRYGYETNDENLGEKEFETLYGPLNEHMFFLNGYHLYQIARVWRNRQEWKEANPNNEGEGEKRLAILATFQKQTEEGFCAFVEKQKTGTILTKEELAHKKEFFLAGLYVDKQIRGQNQFSKN
jgi:hypothetical protein